MTGQLSEKYSSHTEPRASTAAASFARDGGHVVVTQGETNRPHYTLYPDSPPQRFRIGAGSDCNWRLLALGVAAEHAELIWDGHDLFVEPLPGAAVSLNGATHRHRVRVTSDTRLKLGQATLHVLVGSDTPAAEPQETPARGPGFHISRPPRMITEQRSHVRTSMGLVSGAQRSPEQLVELAQQLAKRVASQAAERDQKRMKALARTQPMFAVDAALLNAAAPNVAKPGGLVVRPLVVLSPAAPEARAPETTEGSGLRVRGYASDRPPPMPDSCADSSAVSGMRARVFSDVPLPPAATPFTPADAKAARLEELGRTVHEARAYAPARSENPPAPPRRMAIPPRAFAEPRTRVAPPVAPNLEGSLISSPAALRERYVREFEYQRRSLVPSEPGALRVDSAAVLPETRPSVFAPASPASVKRSRSPWRVAALLAVTLAPLGLPPVRAELLDVGAAALAHPLLRQSALRVEQLVRRTLAEFRGVRQVPVPPQIVTDRP